MLVVLCNLMPHHYELNKAVVRFDLFFYQTKP